MIKGTKSTSSGALEGVVRENPRAVISEVPPWKGNYLRRKKLSPAWVRGLFLFQGDVTGIFIVTPVGNSNGFRPTLAAKS